jgi:hypothetical protein
MEAICDGHHVGSLEDFLCFDIRGEGFAGKAEE